ncbi:hypothetical protein, partial [Alcanivorax sp. HI0044]|uniref:hypothetical protein n=1 Tax=Alcanivorax sp. HI0044 TaxID=1822234 RepID=UPI001E392B5A
MQTTNVLCWLACGLMLRVVSLSTLSERLRPRKGCERLEGFSMIDDVDALIKEAQALKGRGHVELM